MAAEDCKRKLSLPAILDGKFFAVESSESDKVVAKCVICKPVKRLSGSLHATTNFLTHLKRVHPSVVKEFEQYKESVSQTRRKAPEAAISTPAVKQTRMDNYTAGNKAISQHRVDELIMNYIVSGMCAIRTVETQAFKDLVQGLNPAAVVMSRQTLSRQLVAKRSQLSCDLKAMLAAVQYVCITADAWSTCNKGFLGITAHWIGEESLQRHSAALSCARLKGSHTYDVIAEAVSHPFFKLRWLPVHHVESCRLLFSRAVLPMSRDRDHDDSNQNPSSVNMGHEDDFFTFTSASEAIRETHSDSKIQLELANYLEDSRTELSMLHQYPHVKQVFMKYNTAIPSSAPVERLFSFGSLIHTDKRNRLSDQTFETLLLLKANSTLVH